MSVGLAYREGGGNKRWLSSSMGVTNDDFGEKNEATDQPKAPVAAATAKTLCPVHLDSEPENGADPAPAPLRLGADVVKDRQTWATDRPRGLKARVSDADDMQRVSASVCQLMVELPASRLKGEFFASGLFRTTVANARLTRAVGVI
jgi:hypothetical protein